MRKLGYAKIRAFDLPTHGQFFWNFRTELEERWDFQRVTTFLFYLGSLDHFDIYRPLKMVGSLPKTIGSMEWILSWAKLKQLVTSQPQIFIPSLTLPHIDGVLV